jgi:hypothetical protein
MMAAHRCTQPTKLGYSRASFVALLKTMMALKRFSVRRRGQEKMRVAKQEFIRSYM